MKIFVGSTSRDLKDCREKVAHTIRDSLVSVIYMDKFIYDDHNENVLQYCLEKVESATHYIGLFAYWRGLQLSADDVPEEYAHYIEMSITEAEYEHANMIGLRSVIFLPERGSNIDLSLRDKVEQEKQRPEQLQAQERFLNRVANHGLVHQYDGLDTLKDLTASILSQWLKRKPLLDGQAKLKLRKPFLSIQQQDDVHDIAKLGRIEHVLDFMSAITHRRIFKYALSTFLIYGISGFEMFIQRISQELSSLGDCHVVELAHIDFDLPLCWVNDVNYIINSIRGEDWTINSLEQLAQFLGDLLDYNHLLLKISVENITEFENGIEGFMTQFLSPLSQLLIGKYRYHLVVLLIDESGDVNPDWEAFLAQEEKHPSPEKITLLPALDYFKYDDLQLWLKDIYSDPQQNDKICQMIMNRTDGNPDKVYKIAQRLTQHREVTTQ